MHAEVERKIKYVDGPPMELGEDRASASTGFNTQVYRSETYYSQVERARCC